MYDALVKEPDDNPAPTIFNAPISTMCDKIQDLSRQIQEEDGTGYGRAWPMYLVSFEVTGFPAIFGNESATEAGWQLNPSRSGGVTCHTTSGMIGAIRMATAENESKDGSRKVLGSQLDGICSEAECSVISTLCCGRCSVWAMRRDYT